MSEIQNTDRPMNVLDRIAAIRAGLAPTAGRIADFISRNAADVVHMSVTEVAESAGASEGSVVGFCQQLGARGFQQIKIALVRDLVQPVQFIQEDLSPNDGLTDVVAKIFGAGLHALQDTQNALDTKELERAVGAIRKASRVEVFGIGSAAPIAEDATYRLLRIGINARASVDTRRCTQGAPSTDALGCSAARSVVVGDNPATDGALAASIGSAFVPVLAQTVDVRSASRRALVR